MSRFFLSKGFTLLSCAFFVILFCTGIFIHRDYGMSWDEQTQRNYGRIVYDFVFTSTDELTNYHDRYYGPVIEFFLYSAERQFDINDLQQIYWLRHLLTFFVFLVGVYSFYLLAKRYLHTMHFALLGALLLVLSPRIFADAFYNSKDIPFMSFYALSLYSLLRLIQRQSYGNALFHACCCALLIDTRVLGIIIPCITGIAMVLSYLQAPRDQKTARHSLQILLTYAIALLFVTYAFWPTLWSHPLTSFIEAIKRMSVFPWPLSILYMGNSIQATSLPWHYTPVWIGITTPPLYIFFFFIGFGFTLYTTLKRPLQNIEPVTILLSLLLPLGLVIFLKSTLYDGWRHLFFLYIPFLILTLAGLQKVWNIIPLYTSRHTKIRIFMGGIFTIQLLFIVSFIISNHPYQNLYFNTFTGGIVGAKGRYEMDYWGLSYLEGLKYILKHDGRDMILINVENDAGKYSLDMLTETERGKLILVNTAEEANYLLSNYRWHPEAYPYQEIYSVEREGVKILSVFSVK